MSAPLFTAEQVAAAQAQNDWQTLTARMEAGFAQVARTMLEREAALRLEMDSLRRQVDLQAEELRVAHRERDHLRDQLQRGGEEGRRRKWSLQDFPRFSGDNDLKQWTIAMHVKGEFFSFREEELVDVALQCLTGRAQVWYHAFRESGKARPDWSTLCELLRKACAASSNLQDKAPNDLLACKQTASVEAYVEEFQLKMMQLGKAAPGDAFLLAMFKKGLKPELQRYVAMVQPSTLEAAVDRALQMGELPEWAERQVSFKNVPRTEVTPRPEPRPEPMQLGALPSSSRRSPSPNRWQKQQGKQQRNSPQRRQHDGPKTWDCGLCRMPHLLGQHCPQFEALLKKFTGNGRA
jgi:Ty3 transposon capsid-like protein